MKPTLVVLAAGMASRYGSMKQVEGFGPFGETIMEYSIYDAIRAGFGKVIFIIRKEFENNFRSLVGKKFENKISVEYVFQELNSFTDGATIPADRTKPWGTAHAVLCTAEIINEPFAVINADDFYGSDSFMKAYDFLVHDANERVHALIGYPLSNTLSTHGTVNRGVCNVDDQGNLISISERINISRMEGKIQSADELEPKVFSDSTQASMNFWCFTPSVFEYTKKLFHEFLKQNSESPKSEFFIPSVADQFIKEKRGVVKVISSSSNWFGVTYKEDAVAVKASLMQLIHVGKYPEKLW